MDLICDSNVWYDFQRGAYDPLAIKDCGHRLILSPITYLEIISGIDERNFGQRSAVCAGIIRHCDEVIDDPERHLASLWGIPLSPIEIDWQEAIRAVSQASSLEELGTGVTISSGTCAGRTNLEAAREWRVANYDRFCEQVEETVDLFCPGYRDARQARQAIALPRQHGDLLHAAVKLPDVQRLLVPATLDRVSALTGEVYPSPGEADTTRVHDILNPYISVYCEYIHDAATRKPPSPNDHGDFEFFIYLQDNRRLWTSDRRWIRLAEAAGMSDWLFVANDS